MSKRTPVARSCMLLFVFLTLNAELQPQGTRSQNNPAKGSVHFAAGKKLIEANCIDCMGAAQAGMEHGIRELETALKDGYPDEKAAYELLADAYAEMATYTEKQGDISKGYEVKRVTIVRKLFELYPEDPAVLDRYQAILTSETERIEILKRLIRIKKTPAAQFELGYLLIKKPQNVKQGLSLVRDAILAEHQPEAILSYTMNVLGRLKECECPLADESMWEQRVQAAFYKATSGEGDSHAMAEFQHPFAAALEKVNCKNI